jgi:hypothetical protein
MNTLRVVFFSTVITLSIFSSAFADGGAVEGPCAAEQRAKDQCVVEANQIAEMIHLLEEYYDSYAEEYMENCVNSQNYSASQCQALSDRLTAGAQEIQDLHRQGEQAANVPRSAHRLILPNCTYKILKQKGTASWSVPFSSNMSLASGHLHCL